MAFGDRMGALGIILTLISFAVPILWPDKKWIGWLSLSVAVLLLVGWGWMEIGTHVPKLRAQYPILSTVCVFILGGFVAISLWFLIQPNPSVKTANHGTQDQVDVQIHTLPASRPIVVPISYGKILSGPETGHTGLGIRNDGGETAYMISAASDIQIPHVGSVSFGGTPQTLMKGQIAYFYSYRKEGNTSYLGSRLYDFMVKSHLDSLTVPITYKDINGNWYQTDAIIIKDQMARSTKTNESGLRFDWKQKIIPTLQSTVFTVDDVSNDDPRIYPEISDDRKGLYKRTPFVLKNRGGDVAHSIQILDLKINAGQATFGIVDHIFPGEEETVDPDVPQSSVLDSRVLTGLLSREWNNAANLNLEDGLIVPMKLTYTDSSKKKQFEVSFDLVYNGLKDHLKQQRSEGYLKNEKTIFTKNIVFRRLS